MISVIALLIAMLLPALEGARFAAKISMCGNNMRQLQIGTWLFAEDHDGKLLRHPDLPETDIDRWDSNNVNVVRPFDWRELSFLPYFDDNRAFFYCPDNEFVTVDKFWPATGAHTLSFTYASLSNINPELPGQAWSYDQTTADRFIAKTINDDPSKGLWADHNTWEEGPYGAYTHWPNWLFGNHPGTDFRFNPGSSVAGRWLVTLGGSASWDQFTEPDTESKAMRRRILLQASNIYYQSY